MPAMSSTAAASSFSASGSPAPAPRPLASWAKDPDNAKVLALLAWFAGSMFALGGLAAGTLLTGGGGKPGGPGPVAPAASASAEPVAVHAPSPEAPVAPGGCPNGMVRILGGKFKMGAEDADLKNSSPVHEVTLNAFCIDNLEVTASDYKACVTKGNCEALPEIPDYPEPEGVSTAEHDKTRTALADFCTYGQDGRERHPINCVTWEHADTYCKDHKKRLPTEAEWEYTARGSVGHKFPWGDEPANHTLLNACGLECTSWEVSRGLKPSSRIYEEDDGFFRTAPVGSFPKGKSPSGAYDLAGNVAEWTADWFDPYKAEAATNPTGPSTGERRVLRGGAFNSGSPMGIHTAFRFAQIPSARAPGVGFRCAMTP